MSTTSRRRFLQAAALAPVVPLVGCGDDVVAPPPPPPGGTPFGYGIASGDPRPTSVVLWTHVTSASGAPVALTWELSDTPDFARVVATGSATAEPAHDFTVHAVASGLTPGRVWYYRFRASGHTSPVGRTRTTPTGRVDRLRIAIVSCNNMGTGWWHVFRRIAARADLDAVLHLGDFIYEYPDGYYGNLRALDPPGACIRLADYRRRYAWYRRDPDLQAMLRQHPFIAVWDDHEFANNAWQHGAENHNTDFEGPWEARAAAASQAWREWVPAEPGDAMRIWRRLTYGDLVELAMLDTRLWGRERQIAISDPMTMDMRRQLLGDDQERWLFDALTQSAARWKLLGQQVMLAPLRNLRDPDQWDGYPAARRRLLDLLRSMNVRDVAVLSGDRHASWISELPLDPFDASAYDATTGRGSLAVEFLTPAVSSSTIYSDPVGLPPAFLRDNPHVRYVDLQQRGYIVLDVTPERLQGALFHVDGITRRDGGDERFVAAFSTRTGTAHLVADDAPAPARSDAPPLAPG